MSDKTRSRKMKLSSILSKEEKTLLCECFEKIIDFRLLLIHTQLKIKVNQMILERIISFQNEIRGDS